MKWFERHLNWTWVFAYLLSAVAIWHQQTSSLFLALSGVCLYWFISFWFLHKKGQSFWWLLLMFVGSPSWPQIVDDILKAVLKDKDILLMVSPYIWLIIGITGILCWIPLLLKNKSTAIKKHIESDSKQAQPSAIRCEVAKTNWFKRHLNWTWLFIYLLTLVVAAQCVLFVNSLPPPMKMQYTTENITVYDNTIMKGKGILRADGTYGDVIFPTKKEIPIQKMERGIDEEGIKVRLNLWYWPIYLIGTFLISIWVLKQKGRSLYWLWLTLLLIGFTPLLLSNKHAKKQPNESDLIQL